MTIAQLSMTDAAFLYNESGSTPMHIAAVQAFDVPPQRRANFLADVRKHYAERLHVVPFFTRRAVAMPLGLDHPVWETCTVDIDYHIRGLKLAAPGTQAQLEALIAELHAQPLDRARPLWRYYLIDGFEGDKLVFYTKMHHSAIDGMAGQALLELMYSDTPETPGVPAAETSEVQPSELHSSQAERMRHALSELMLQPFRQAAKVGEQWDAMRKLGAHVARGRSLGAYSRPAPLTRLNAAVGRPRTYAVGSLPLDELRAVGKAQSAKLNDVFMAICSGALREHLLALEALPPTTLLAGVPVSLRELGDRSMNNQVSMMLCALATDIEDPLLRLRAVRDSSTTAKQVLTLTRELTSADMHVPGLPGMMASIASAQMLLPVGTPVPSFCNVVISNVPGPRRAKYLLGARMLSHYPVSIAAHGLALNITVQSYEDRFDFAITACRSALPDAGLLRDRMLAAWAALRARALPVAVPPAASLVAPSVAPVVVSAAAQPAMPMAAPKGDLRAA